jgi:RNA 2',3'-cyclic 3'-phosphodiesterase
VVLRCFIAIEIPDAVKRAVSEATDILKKSGADVKWTADENIHITLQFLGATDDSVIPQIKEALDKILLPYPPFYITISQVGSFPGGRRPRVLWIGIQEPEILINLQKDIANGMVRFGYPIEERGFTPHITIGRVKSNRNLHELMKRLDEIRSASFSGFDAEKIVLMKSELKPSGAKYYSLAEIPFGRRNNVAEG